MTLHLQLTINLWWLVYYLAAGVALWPVYSVALEWSLGSSRSVAQRLRTYTIRRCLPRVALSAVAWPLILVVVVDDLIKTHKAHRQMRELIAKSEARRG